MNGLTSLLQSFSNFLAPTIDFLIWMFPIKIYRINDGERGVVLTLGKVRRKKAEVGPGISICFCFEEITVVQALGCYIDFTEQALMTKNKMCLVNSSCEYIITDVKSAVLETEDLEMLVAGTCLDQIREYSQAHNFESLIDSERLTKDLANIINKKVQKNGVRIKKLMITDLRPHNIAMVCDTIEDLAFEIINKISYIGQDSHLMN